MVQAKIELPNFEKEFSKNILLELQKKFNAKMPAVATKVEARLQIALSTLIKNSSEYQALVAGDLLGELGLPDPNAAEAIIQTWANGVEVAYTKTNKLGAISIGMIQQDYSDVLTLPEASYTYVSNNPKIMGPVTIEWLRWLLLESTAIVVTDYQFEAKGGKGRTGLGYMVKGGGGWRVPVQYAGTATDNFATRALEDIGKTIDEIVRQEITKGIK